MDGEIMRMGDSGLHMGSGNIIPFADYRKAIEALMERNYPDILHDRQQGAVFLPETHLPKRPAVIHMAKYEAQKLKLDAHSLAFLGMEPGTSELSHAKGDRTELGLAEELSRFYSGKEVVVLLGPTFRKPGGQQGHIEEHDVVIVDKTNKAHCIFIRALKLC